MADNGIKKARITSSSLPDIISGLEGYLVRYRVVSEDRNRLSHWSPIVLIQPDYDFVVGTTSVENSPGSGHITLIWDPVSIEKDGVLIRTETEYDVWLRWDTGDNGDYVYGKRVIGNSSTFIIPSTYSRNGVVMPQPPGAFTAEVYLKGSPISRDSDYLLSYTVGPEAI
jgi:hypothetical protein